jgi:hypothetical protein
MADIPPWLNVGPTSYLQAAESGTQAGLRAGEIATQQILAQERQKMAQQELGQRQQEINQRNALAQAQMSQNQQLTMAEMQMRRDIATQNNQRMQAQQAMLNAYRQGQLGLGQQRVENQENFQDQRAADAAMSYRDEQGFANAIANGMTPQQALFQFPRAKASMVSALTRTGTGGAEELMLRRIGAQSASRDLDQADRAIQAFQSKWGGNLPVPPELQQQRDEARARVQRLLGDRSGLSDAVPAAAPQMSETDQKIAKANELRKLHPDWDKKKIIEMINKGVTNTPSDSQPAGYDSY